MYTSRKITGAVSTALLMKKSIQFQEILHHINNVVLKKNEDQTRIRTV